MAAEHSTKRSRWRYRRLYRWKSTCSWTEDGVRQAFPALRNVSKDDLMHPIQAYHPPKSTTPRTRQANPQSNPQQWQGKSTKPRSQPLSSFILSPISPNSSHHAPPPPLLTSKTQNNQSPPGIQFPDLNQTDSIPQLPEPRKPRAPLPATVPEKRRQEALVEGPSLPSLPMSSPCIYTKTRAAKRTTVITTALESSNQMRQSLTPAP